MMCQVVIIGRLVDNNIEIEETNDGTKHSKITLTVDKPYKNNEGIYEKEYIDVQILGNMVEHIKEHCEKDTIIGIKGRLHTNIEEDKDGNTKKELQVMADKITLLTRSKEKHSRDEER